MEERSDDGAMGVPGVEPPAAPKARETLRERETTFSRYRLAVRQRSRRATPAPRNNDSLSIPRVETLVEKRHPPSDKRVDAEAPWTGIEQR